jgi:hypothetical protein
MFSKENIEIINHEIMEIKTLCRELMESLNYQNLHGEFSKED